MLPRISIKSFYTLALAEGEGVGTAYEYFAKRLVLSPWLAAFARPRTILVAGLPQKYGASLDFLQLAADYAAPVTVADERPQALARLEAALAALPAGQLGRLRPRLIQVQSLPALAEVAGAYDLALSSEVLQRLSSTERLAYFRRLQQLAPAIALFAPNGANHAHTTISGLGGLRRQEMNALLATLPFAPQLPPPQSDYVDMPPFPPGITRDEAQREQANSGTLEAVAMWGLQGYARLERLLPRALRRSQAHIVYGLAATRPAPAPGGSSEQGGTP